MYNPLLPNNYRDVKVACWKRTREEEQQNDVACLLEKESNAFIAPFGLPESILSPLTDKCASATLPDAGQLPPLHLSAEELHQRRVRQSAAMGILTAMQLMRDDLEASHKAKVAEGTDRKGRIRQKLGKLLDVAATEKSGVDGEGGAAKRPPGSLFSGAPLVFQRAQLAAGGYVVREAGTPAAGKKRAPRGKPSSTILIRFTNNGPPLEMFDGSNSNTVEARDAFLEAIQDECGQCGIVRSVRYVLLRKDEQVTLRATLETKLEEMRKEQGVSADVVDPEVLLAREAIRVFVRFDAVANAFKALEMLQQKHNGNWDVCFFPTQLFDAGNLGPAEGESLCGA